MKGSLVIVGFFVLGILAGLSGIVPEKIVEGNLTFYALCALLFFVGIGVGSDRNIVSRFKSLDVRMALLPAGTMLGTFAGALAAALILPERSATDCLAVGSGFGYYSLSSIFITGYRGAELGTVALLSNIIREMATLLLAPLLARFCGPLAPISAGGVTSMDTTSATEARPAPSVRRTVSSHRPEVSRRPSARPSQARVQPPASTCSSSSVTLPDASARVTVTVPAASVSRVQVQGAPVA